MYVFNFFFSSRRRHTRSKRDWSSDVCSSDLLLRTAPAAAGADALLDEQPAPQVALVGTRSEERRVGKECRSRWSPYQKKKRRKLRRKFRRTMENKIKYTCLSHRLHD